MRGLVAQFLHHFPQYRLSDVTDGTLSMPEFVYLVGGMLDIENPQATETGKERVDRAVREAHDKASDGQKRGW